MRRVVATCHPDNVGSARVLEKAGMEREGRMRGHLRLRGAWRDSLLYAAGNRDGPKLWVGVVPAPRRPSSSSRA